MPLPGWLRLPAPTTSVPGWQVSPVVDAGAYAFSWLWVLVPLWAAGPVHPTDYYALFALILTINTLHRHFGVPLVYLDREVYDRNVTRFSVVPALMVLAVVAMPLVSRVKVPAGFFGAEALGAALAGVALLGQVLVLDGRGWTPSGALRALVVAPFAVALAAGLGGAYRAALGPASVVTAFAFGTVAATLHRAAPAEVRAPRWLAAVCFGVALTVVGLAVPDLLDRWPGKAQKLGVVTGVVFAVQVFWGLWHVTMQKVGILRMYAAKQADVAPGRRAPMGVDRLLVWGTFPVYLFLLAPGHRAEILKAAGSAKKLAVPLLDVLESARPFLGPPAVLLAVGSVVWFLSWEWRSSRFGSPARLTMGLGTAALNLAVYLWPVKGVLAYTFSHGLEYLVFVWAFQRRRYAAPLAHRPLMQRLLQRPVLAYGGFLLLVGGFFFLTDFGRHYGVPVPKPKLLGVGLTTWVGSWAVWEALFHYYQDGFMWKMRSPALRASL